MCGNRPERSTAFRPPRRKWRLTDRLLSKAVTATSSTVVSPPIVRPPSTAHAPAASLLVRGCTTVTCGSTASGADSEPTAWRRERQPSSTSSTSTYRPRSGRPKQRTPPRPRTKWRGLSRRSGDPLAHHLDGRNLVRVGHPHVRSDLRGHDRGPTCTQLVDASCEMRARKTVAWTSTRPALKPGRNLSSHSGGPVFGNVTRARRWAAGSDLVSLVAWALPAGVGSPESLKQKGRSAERRPTNPGGPHE